MNLRVTRVDPAKVERLRAWMAQVRERADEARATLADESVRHELAVLVESADGPLLVYAVECDDFDAAVAVAARSEHPIDAEHNRVMTEVRGDPVPMEELLDLRL